MQVLPLEMPFFDQSHAVLMGQQLTLMTILPLSLETLKIDTLHFSTKMQIISSIRGNSFFFAPEGWLGIAILCIYKRNCGPQFRLWIRRIAKGITVWGMGLLNPTICHEPANTELDGCRVGAESLSP